MDTASIHEPELDNMRYTHLGLSGVPQQKPAPSAPRHVLDTPDHVGTGTYEIQKLKGAAIRVGFLMLVFTSLALMFYMCVHLYQHYQTNQDPEYVDLTQTLRQAKSTTRSFPEGHVTTGYSNRVYKNTTGVQ